MDRSLEETLPHMESQYMPQPRDLAQPQGEVGPATSATAGHPPSPRPQPHALVCPQDVLQHVSEAAATAAAAAATRPPQPRPLVQPLVPAML